MNLTGMSVEDVAPLVANLEDVLRDPAIKTVELRNQIDDPHPLKFSREQAEQLLANLERQFFGTVN